MEIIRNIKRMQSSCRKLAARGKTIGLVPTMGFLHDGHLSLVKIARRHADIVIATIFVNPAQFAPNEDFSRYPRDEKGDLEKLRRAGTDFVFIPKASDIYPEDFESAVSVEKITGVLEGESRPGHFRGVTTIVAKLFNITRPDAAVFGMKDFQQAAVLKRMVIDLNYPIKIIITPTVREKSGLAMSSRNKYFNTEQKKEAVCLYQALTTAKKMIKREKILRSGILKKRMIHIIKEICPTAEIDYIAFTDMNTLAPMKSVQPGCVSSLAVRVHGVRLIDNMRLL
ncbi:Pantothenate synthetase [Candidatus Zixiibacteriota bacterium]|nr:Pantothenate synthetase [candidate division Zixibacteria bacterium]